MQLATNLRETSGSVGDLLGNHIDKNKLRSDSNFDVPPVEFLDSPVENGIFFGKDACGENKQNSINFDEISCDIISPENILENNSEQELPRAPELFLSPKGDNEVKTETVYEESSSSSESLHYTENRDRGTKLYSSYSDEGPEEENTSSEEETSKRHPLVSISSDSYETDSESDKSSCSIENKFADKRKSLNVLESIHFTNAIQPGRRSEEKDNDVNIEEDTTGTEVDVSSSESSDKEDRDISGYYTSQQESGGTSNYESEEPPTCSTQSHHNPKDSKKGSLEYDSIMSDNPSLLPESREKRENSCTTFASQTSFASNEDYYSYDRVSHAPVRINPGNYNPNTGKIVPSVSECYVFPSNKGSAGDSLCQRRNEGQLTRGNSPYEPDRISRGSLQNRGDERSRPYTAMHYTSRLSQRKERFGSLYSTDNITGVPVESIEYLSERVSKKPSDLEAQFSLAKVLIAKVQKSSKLSMQMRGLDEAQKKKIHDNIAYSSDKALKCLKKVINEGDKSLPFLGHAFFILGDCNANGMLGLKVNHKRALWYYKKAEKLNHCTAICRLGLCYEVGAGVKQNTQKAMQYYFRAVALGDSTAMCKLGTSLLSGVNGCPKNVQDGIMWLHKSIGRNNTGSAKAHYELAKCYSGDAGYSVGRYLAINYELSFQHYLESAKFGFLSAQCRVATCYEFGIYNVKRNPRASIYWYSRAAEKGDSESQIALASWYITGAGNILPQSDDEAYLWINKAATNGCPKANYIMGYMYSNGIGVPRDLTKARKWYIRSLNMDIKMAVNRIKDINTIISSEGINKQKAYQNINRNIENRLHKQYDDPACRIM